MSHKRTLATAAAPSMPPDGTIELDRIIDDQVTVESRQFLDEEHTMSGEVQLNGAVR